jgi:hypothetical protein
VKPPPTTISGGRWPASATIKAQFSPTTRRWAALGDRKRAVQDLEQVVSRHPEDPGALNDLAWFLIERQIDIDRAITLAKAAQVRRPRDPNILDTLGWGYFRKAIPLRMPGSWNRLMQWTRPTPLSSVT